MGFAYSHAPSFGCGLGYSFFFGLSTTGGALCCSSVFGYYSGFACRTPVRTFLWAMQMKGLESILSRVSEITSIPYETLLEEYHKCSHDGRKQILHNLKRILAKYKSFNPVVIEALQRQFVGKSE